MRSKIMNPRSALLDIKDNSIVAISGFNMSTTPEYLILELYKLYKETGHPKDIFLISDALPASPGKALDLIAEKLYNDQDQELLRGALMPFLGFSPWFQKLVIENRIECYGWPIGITAYWFREIASGRPGLITQIGKDTFLDPESDGGFLNELGRTKGSCRISAIAIEKEEYLLYQAPKPEYAFIRATTGDENGNLSVEDEGIRGTILAIAQATKAQPKQGHVIGQVKQIAKSYEINPRDVEVPGPLVDCIVASPEQYHWQTATAKYDPRISYKGFASKIANSDKTLDVAKESEKVIARRVLLQLVRLLEIKQAPVLVNLGIGIPAFVSEVAAEEQVDKYIITVLESGLWGGIALSGADFGLALNPFALSTIPDMFSNFEGGIIDAASLGFLQIDKEGNVNPSMLPNKVVGPGGFPVIAGGAPRIYFAGSFTAGPTKINLLNDQLQIIHDGSISKFVKNVFKVFFSGRQALKQEHEILYVTERAVFSLKKDSIRLEEFAPGVHLEKDILAKMDFAPLISPSLKEMDKLLFGQEKMNLKEETMRMFE